MQTELPKQLQSRGVDRWNVYESSSGYSSAAGKEVWGEWVLVGSHKTEEAASSQIQLRQDHNHAKNSMNDYGIVAVRWEKRHELILPANSKVTQDKSVTAQESPELQNQVTELQKQLHEAQTENQALATKNQELQNRLEIVVFGNQVLPDYEAIRTRTLNKLKVGRQSAQGKAIDAFIREL